MRNTVVFFKKLLFLFENGIYNFIGLVGVVLFLIMILLAPFLGLVLIIEHSFSNRRKKQENKTFLKDKKLKS